MSFKAFLATGLVAAIVGGSLLLGNSVAPRQAQQQLEELARQQRRGAAQALQVRDGFDVDGQLLTRPPPPAKSAPTGVSGEFYLGS